jgi:hypothetical protein
MDVFRHRQITSSINIKATETQESSYHAALVIGSGQETTISMHVEVPLQNAALTSKDRPMWWQGIEKTNLLSRLLSIFQDVEHLTPALPVQSNTEKNQ